MKRVLAGTLAGVMISAGAATAAVKTLRNGDKVFYGKNIYCQTSGGSMVCANWKKPNSWMVGINNEGVYIGKHGHIVISRFN